MAIRYFCFSSLLIFSNILKLSRICQTFVKIKQLRFLIYTTACVEDARWRKNKAI